MDLTQIRAGLAAHGTPTRGRRYPPELRDGIRVHICSARATGQSWASLARDLGLRINTLQRWAEPPTAAAALVPVVAVRTDAVLRIRTASGAVLEGLDLDTAVRVLRALG